MADQKQNLFDDDDGDDYQPGQTAGDMPVPVAQAQSEDEKKPSMFDDDGGAYQPSTDNTEQTYAQQQNYDGYDNSQQQQWSEQQQ